MKIFKTQKYIYTEYEDEHIENLNKANVPYEVKTEILFFGFQIREGYIRYSALMEIIVISGLIYTFFLR